MDTLFSELTKSSRAELAKLSPIDLACLNARAIWVNTARPNQLTRDDDRWQVHMSLAGRGWGKTKVECEAGWWLGYRQPGWRIAVVAPTERDVRDTVFEGESGLLACTPSELIDNYNRSLSELTFKNGAQYKGFVASEPERLRGPQHHAALCDELAAWEKAQETWDQVMFGLRLGKNPKVIIGSTPKPIPLIKWLVKQCLDTPDTHVLIKGNSYENKANLAPTFFSVIARYENTRLGRQEIYAEILDDVAGALWNRTLLDATRMRASDMDELLKRLVRVVVAIDPAMKNKSAANETGIIVAGIDERGHGYVLHDGSSRFAPIDWAKTAIHLYKTYNADRIVAEVNNGGDMVENTLRQCEGGENIPYRAVSASRGKFTRAEPVSALYEQKKIHHVGMHVALEDQMCTWDPMNPAKPKAHNNTESVLDAEASGSPDRVDALVWAFTDLIITAPAEQETLVAAPEITNQMPWQSNSPGGFTPLTMSERARV